MKAQRNNSCAYDRIYYTRNNIKNTRNNVTCGQGSSSSTAGHQLTASLSILHRADFGDAPNRVETAADHRPGTPEVALRQPRRMASYRQLRALRRRLRLTQDGLARRIGAAGKAVIYQWESRKRTRSPVLWRQVMRLQPVKWRTVEASAAVPKASRGMGSTPSQDGGERRHAEVGIGL